MLIPQKEVVAEALVFAYKAHDGQVRKYTGEPYIVPPISVAALVASITDNQGIIAAALLHDTVEDTDVTIADIHQEFGGYIAAWVSDLTDVSKPEDGNRASRKAIDLQHTARALPPAKTIKLADLIDNSKSILERDPNFAVYYMKEKRALLEVLKEGDKTLYVTAKKIVDDYFIRVGEKK